MKLQIRVLDPKKDLAVLVKVNIIAVSYCRVQEAHQKVTALHRDAGQVAGNTAVVTLHKALLLKRR